MMDNCRPLHLAAFNDHVPLMGLLVAGGAALDDVDSGGQQPLVLAAKGQSEGCVRELLRLGADAKHCDMYGNTAAIEAVMRKSPACLKLLLPVSDLTATNISGLNALHIAVTAGSTECFELLLPLYPDVDVRTKPRQPAYGRTSLHLAAQSGHHAIAKTLLRRGAARCAVDTNGMTPLTCAAIAGELSLVTLLVGKAGNRKLNPANGLDAVDHEGRTALSCAVIAGRTKVVGALMDAGASVELPGSERGALLALALRLQPDNAELHALLSGNGPLHAPGTTCDHCGLPDSVQLRLKTCTSCQVARYCSTACATQRWPAHKRECRAAKATREESNSPVVLPWRVAADPR
jgi:ankyrin repeat protein